MDIDSSANFLVGSILTCLGLAIVGILIVFLNNIFSKYWKPVNWGSWVPKWVYEAYGQPPVRFMTKEEYERVAPTFEQPENRDDKPIDLSKKR